MASILVSLSAIALAVGAVSASNDGRSPLVPFLKRQAPGTPEYNCHDNCGQAIIASQGPDVCHNVAFLTDYDACLQCAGPDNVNIWSIYGPALTAAAASCTLATAPLSGHQPTVASAIPAASSGASSGVSGAPTAAAPSSGSALPSTTSSVGSGTAASTTTSAAANSTNGAGSLGNDALGAMVVGALGAMYAAVN